MAAVDGLRSAYAKVGEVVYFGRMLDKIRLADQNKLPAGYNLGDQAQLGLMGIVVGSSTCSIQKS
jgi:hypothetical protein